MSHRFRASSRWLPSRALTVLLLAGALACGWELGVQDRGPSRPVAGRDAPAVTARADAEGDPAAPRGAAPADAGDRPAITRTVSHATDPGPRPVAPPVGPVIGPLAGRARPDTIGVLLERRVERRVSGIDVDDYLLWLPPGLEKADGKWPLLLWLHGRSLRGHDLDRLKRYGPPALLAHGQALPFVVVAPQLPPDGRWADLDPVAEIVEEVAAKYPVDRDRIYLMGFSMGGGGAYRMAFSHGDLFAAMIGIAGHTPPATEENVRAVASLPFLAIHGEQDVRVPLTPAKRMAAALATAGASLFEFRMAPGMNHSRLERLTRQDDLYEWLLAHRRSRIASNSAVAGR